MKASEWVESENLSLRSEILATLESVQQIPTLPEVVMRLQQEIEGDDTDASSVARIVSEDPVLTLKVLRIANSVLYHVGAEIVDVRQAVTRLGMNELRNLVYAVSVLRLMPEVPHIDYKRFWRHSITVAYTAKSMLRCCGAESGAGESSVSGLVFVAGLLHDLGILVLDQVFPEQYALALDMTGRNTADTNTGKAGVEGLPLYAAEEEYLGISHAEVGGIIMRRWGMPDSLVEAVTFHDDPLSADEHRTLACIVHIANFVCNNRGIDNGTSVPPEGFSDACWEWLGLSVDEIPAIIEMADQDAKKSQTLMLLASS